MAYLTVFTATYNRAGKLKRVFESLQRQGFKDFEWLIVDDGSTDGTDKLVESFIDKADFKIRYYWKENGGVHTARNYSYPLIKTKYTVSMDSDDWFVDDALQRIHDIWESIPESEYDRIWQVSGRCMIMGTNELVGALYPDGINELKGIAQNKARHKCLGEKCCCRKTDILVSHPFPEFSDVKDITGDYIWEQIDEKYDTWCTNEIFRVYDDDSVDSMGKGKGHPTRYYKTQYYMSVLMVNKLLSHILWDKRVLIGLVNLPRSAWLSKTPYLKMLNELNSLSKKLLVLVITPASFVIMKIHDRGVKCE